MTSMTSALMRNGVRCAAASRFAEPEEVLRSTHETCGKSAERMRERSRCGTAVSGTRESGNPGPRSPGLWHRRSSHDG